MPCEIKGNMITCSTIIKKNSPCEWCNFPHTKLCDFDLGKRTCDKRMCNGHSKSVGLDLDYCPDHIKTGGNENE